MVLTFMPLWNFDGGAAKAQSLSDFPPSRQREILDLRKSTLLSEWRATSIYREVLNLCFHDNRFRTYVARTRKTLIIAENSFWESFHFLEPTFLAELYGNHFLQSSVNEAIHSKPFYLALRDCSENDPLTREAMLVVFVGGDIGGRLAFLTFALALGRLVHESGIMGEITELLRTFPLLKKLAMIGSVGYGIYDGLTIYSLISPSHRRTRSLELKRRQVDLDPFHEATKKLLIQRIEEVQTDIYWEEGYLSAHKLSFDQKKPILNRIDKQKLAILNMKMAMEGQ